MKMQCLYCPSEFCRIVELVAHINKTHTSKKKLNVIVCGFPLQISTGKRRIKWNERTIYRRIVMFGVDGWLFWEPYKDGDMEAKNRACERLVNCLKRKLRTK